MGPQKKIILSKAAKEASTSDRVIISCQYKGQCATKRCRRFKENQECLVYCHRDAEHDCGFLAPLSKRTKVAIRPKKRARTNTKGDDVPS